MKLNKNLGLVGIFAIGLAAMPSESKAITYSFDNVTANSLADVAIGEAQLSVAVTDAGAGKVEFRFSNAGPFAASITDIYFDDVSPKALINNSSVSISDSGSGVSFSVGASPSNLPGGNSIGFSATFGADSNSPTQPMGVNPGEWVALTFALANPATFASLIESLNNPGFRIGIHVQGFASGGSESFVASRGGSGNNVPDGGTTAILLGSGMLGLAMTRKLIK